MYCRILTFPLHSSLMHKAINISFLIYCNQFQQLENRQSGGAMASNSSDRSDRSDKPMDQKVCTLSSCFL
jgi:hypothetical protein